jgi:hypothetical protein
MGEYGLCGGGFMGFIHRPKSKILKILKNIIYHRQNLLEDGLYSKVGCVRKWK